LNYKEACKVLESVSNLGSRPGLNNIRHLCTLLGNPQDSLKFIHVAGTNGKGSVCAMAASVLSAAGYRTGLYTSPYIENYTDSLYINGKAISKPDFAGVFSQVSEKAALMAGSGPTEFELLTACAFVWFLQKKCDIVVLETGMGGTLDATNLIKTPLASVITAVSIDHTAFLGETLEEIAAHKCGIIKEGGVTVCYPDQQKTVLEIVKNTAAERNNEFYIPDMSGITIMGTGLEGTRMRCHGLDLRISLAGRHQAFNAATVIETMEALRERHGLDISGEDICAGIKEAYVPARQETILEKPLVILDGSHNIQGIEALADTLKKNLRGRSITVIMGMLADKQYEQCITTMASLADKFMAVRPDNPRALDPEETAAIAKRYCGGALPYEDADQAVKDAARYCGSSGAIIICGSFYLTAKMRRAVENFFGKREDM
jgi:dihydrofolate synthase / folylpolyglutamate synthase